MVRALEGTIATRSYWKPQAMHMLFIFVLILTVSSLLAQTSPVYTEAEIQEKIRQFISQKYADQNSRFKIEWLTSRKNWTPGIKVDSLSVRYRQDRLPRGKTVMLVEAYRNNRVVRRLNYAIMVRVFEKVAVCQHKVPAKNQVNMDMFKWEEKETTNLMGTPITIDQNISTMQNKRNLKKGEIIVQERLQQIPLIKRGESATLVYDSGMIHIKMKAKALQNGGEGETIWFLYPDSRKRFKGRILSKNFAEVVK